MKMALQVWRDGEVFAVVRGDATNQIRVLDVDTVVENRNSDLATASGETPLTGRPIDADFVEPPAARSRRDTGRASVLRKGVRPSEQHFRESLERVDLGEQRLPRDS